MTKPTFAVFSLIAVTLAATVFFPTASQAGHEENKRMIVKFSDNTSETEQDELIGKHGGVRIKKLHNSHTNVIVLSNEKSEHELRKNKNVEYIEEDALAFVSARTSPQPAQTLSWGIDRVDAELVWPLGNTADPIRVGIIDTGISLTHPDLQQNIKGGINTIRPGRSANDDNGHGSHVAGIIGAVNNAIGVVGVAPQVDLYAIKALNSTGSGYLSDIIEGLDWAVANNMQILNMSLGTTSDSQAMHDAIIRAHNAGIVIVAAAGNSGGAVEYPAKYPEVIAVSATDSNNQIAYFSSRGPEVDLAAPGVSIFSSYKGSAYATLSGTSMATPHVVGAAALLLNTPVGSYDTDSDGMWDKQEVQNKLQDHATDLGLVGLDDLYGFGLVNAFNAVQL